MLLLTETRPPVCLWDCSDLSGIEQHFLKAAHQMVHKRYDSSSISISENETVVLSALYQSQMSLFCKPARRASLQALHELCIRQAHQGVYSLPEPPSAVSIFPDAFGVKIKQPKPAGHGCPEVLTVCDLYCPLYPILADSIVVPQMPFSSAKSYR